jgi:cobalamin biosynthesis Mg chelatase CobN
MALFFRYAAPDASQSKPDAARTLNGSGGRGAAVAEAVQVRRLLEANSEELDSLVNALDGQYVLPAAGGDLLRDGPGVLPTGMAAVTAEIVAGLQQSVKGC